MQRKVRWLLIAVLPVFTLACALSEMASNAGQTAPTAQPVPVQPGDLRLDAAASGLQVYTLQFQANFSGQGDQGQTFQSGLLLAEEYDASQPVHHLLARTETSGQPPASLEIYQLAGAQYLVSTELNSQAGCIPLTVDTAGQTILHPADIIFSINRGEQIGQGEIVGGVPGDHFKLAGLNLGVGQADTWDGDIWLASQGGYVLRFTGWAEGQFSLTGQPGRGRLEWTYTLDGTAPVSVALPDDCRGFDFSDVPLPPGAENISQQGAQVIFTSPAQAAEIVDFFHSSLPQNGWTINDEGGTGTLFTLNASKEGRSLQVFVEVVDQASKVTISLR